MAESGRAFADELRTLKRRGCSVLVLHGPGGRNGVCGNLFGSSRHAHVRLAVVTDGAQGGADRADAVIDATGSGVRSCTGAERRTDSGETVEYLDDPGNLGHLAELVYAYIDEVGGEALGPSELRVCLGSAEPLIERAGERATFRYLDDVTDGVRSVRGMAHAHLAANAEVGEAFEPAFDLTIETRTTAAGLHQQRWRLHESGIETGWLRMGRR